MDTSPHTISSGHKLGFPSADLNSNQILSTEGGKEDDDEEEDKWLIHDSLQTSGNKRTPKAKPLTPDSPVKAFSTSLHKKDISYDDLSKNIDANLAEIDMETFRSEDINSILALPAIYSGHFDSVNNGEQCASVSGSLFNGLEIETSVSNRISEDEISICKDEPLFSPQKEPAVHELRTISVDSLDNSSSYDQDLVLTCKANKNNYTIVFEGSETQFSEDSDYHNCLRNSDVGNSELEDVSDTSYSSNSMIQSDLVFTTWSKLKRMHIGRKQKRNIHDMAMKSKSLPNLSYQSVFFNEKIWQWAKLQSNKNSLLSDLDFCQPGGLQVIKKCSYPYTLSLVKLFMKYKVSSRSSILCSEHSASTNSLAMHSLNNVNHCSQTSSKIETKELQQCDADLLNQNYNIKNSVGLDNLNSNQKRQLYVDNIRILDWHHTPNLMESNNNCTLKPYSSANGKLRNSNNLKDSNGSVVGGECDNSQYFEDSLMEAPVLQVKNFNALPIKEEEETDISSGDEVMKTSMSSDCNNCSSTSDDAAVIKNNALEMTSAAVRQDADHNLERIINIFPNCKTNIATPAPTLAEEVTQPKTDSFQNNQSQATQTKNYNGKNCIEMYSAQLSSTNTPKVGCKQVSSERYVRHSSGSRDASPNSSGYASSRHSSVERLQRSSTGPSEDTASKSRPHNKGRNILLTTRNCSTQVPVHVKDGAMQTSTLAASFPKPNGGFLFRNGSKDDICASGHQSEQCTRSGIDNITSSNKPHAKEDKCIYVCFPNYSLPDLSFLKSIVSDDSSSVFLSPTKFRPPQKITRNVRRPKSSDGLDSDSKKRLSNIKDWESLSVLLPDDLKHLISQMHLTEHNQPATQNVSGDSKSFQLSDVATKVDSEKLVSDKTSTDGLKLYSIGQEKCKPTRSSSSQSPSTSCKDLQQDCVKTCTCQHNAFGMSSPKISHSRALPTALSSQTCRLKNLQYHAMQKQSSSNEKPKNCSPNGSKTEPTYPCSNRIYKRHFTPLSGQDQLKICPDYCCEGHSNFIYPESDSHAQVADIMDQNVCCAPCSSLKSPPHQCKGDSVTALNDSTLMNYQVKRNSFCQHVPYCNQRLNGEKRNPAAVELGSSLLQSEKLHMHKGCENVDSDNFFKLEKAPQEFLVSPVQNPPLYASPVDPCQLQNSFRAENNVFHESLKRKTGLVENLQKATLLVYEDHSKSYKHGVACCTSFSVGQKILTSLCPALHTILSDGLLPSVQGFFGPLPNSPWKVTEASVQLEKSKKEVQDLLKLVNSEKLLTDSTYRFNAFILGLLNLGCLEWWLGHLLSSRSLIAHHYHPTALLSLLALPMSTHLQQELMELVSPLTNLPFNLDLAFETRFAAAKAESLLQKCEGSCCNAAKKHFDVQCDKKLSSLTFFMSRAVQEQRCKKGDLEPNLTKDGSVLSSAKFKGDGPDQPVWPGVTTNPFPNLHISKGHSKDLPPYKHSDSKTPESAKHECTPKLYLGLKEKRCKKRITDFSLCSSTDSGCSSQVCQSHDISLAATDLGESESHASNKQEGHQFRKLQQKWEKITLGIENKNSSPKKSSSNPPAASYQNQGNQKKPAENITKKAPRCQVRAPATDDAPRNPKPVTVKRSVSQPPVSKSHPKVTMDAFHEKKHHGPDNIVPQPTRRNRSQIPTLKSMKGVQPKSKIPIQKSGSRVHSSSRDAHN